MLSPFGTRSSRNSPSNSKFIFGPSVWLRGLIKPPPGFGLAYIDWVGQEFGVAAALSGDPAMKAAYESGDIYLGFAKAAKVVPADGTRQTHNRNATSTNNVCSVSLTAWKNIRWRFGLIDIF